MLFEKVRSFLGVESLEQNKKLTLSQNSKVHIEPDFYSAERGIIGEIHAHVGRLISAQLDKIASDILKMLLFDRDSGRIHEKYIVVCDQDEYNQLSATSSVSEIIRQFNIRLLCFDLGKETCDRILKAMRKQNFLI